MTALMICLAGGLGAALRYVAETTLGPRATGHVPWALLLVNASGSAVLGALVGADVGPDTLLVAGTGLCGGFTTFSGAALDAAARTRHDLVAAVTSTAVMLVVCVGAASLGHTLAS